MSIMNVTAGPSSSRSTRSPTPLSPESPLLGLSSIYYDNMDGVADSGMYGSSRSGGFGTSAVVGGGGGAGGIVGMDKTDELDVVPLRANRQLCVRHKQMANQDVNQKLQRSLDNLSTAERSDITHLWSTFSGAQHSKRKIILEGILTMCCFSQLSHLSDSLNLLIRIDPFSLLPREVNLRILGYLDAFSLGRAAQVSKSWKALADDDLLWRRMCGQHIDRKCEKCGWGLPLLERRRLKVELNEGSPAVAVSIGGHEDGHGHGHHAHAHRHGEGEASGRSHGHTHADADGHGDGHHHTGPLLVVSREEALGTGRDATLSAMAASSAPAHPVHLHAEGVCGPGASVNDLKRNADTDDEGSRKRSRNTSGFGAAAGKGVGDRNGKGKGKEREREGDDTEREDSPGPVPPKTASRSGSVRGGNSVQARMTKPWKSVYCERLVVERNWRKGRCKTTTLKGHEDGVMCLQYHTALSSPSHPVLITGSYDKTVRIWNLDTGECLRTLRGHTRAVRALQFDQRLLFTGSMDGTVRMWNWRAGECLRVLEGHTDGVVALHYNGQLLASGSADSTVNIWNFRDGSKFTLRGHEERVNAVLLWDGKTSPGDLDPTMMPSFSGKRGVSPYRSSLDAAIVSASASLSPSASTSTSTHHTSTPHSHSGSTGAQVPPGMMLFSASDDHTIKLWDLFTRKCIRTFSGHRAHVQSVKLLMVDLTEAEIKARKRLRSASPPVSAFDSQSGSVSAWASASNPIAPLLGTAEGAAGMVQRLVDVPEGFDPHAHRRARGEVMPRVFLHDSVQSQGMEVDGLNADVEAGHGHGHGHGQEKDDTGKSQKRPVLVSASLDGTVKVWDVETGCETGTLFGHIEGVWGVDADALRIASASHDRTVKVWDRDAGTCVQTLVGHRGAVTTLQLSDDMIVSGSDDGDVMVWSFAPNTTPSATAVPISSPTPTPNIPMPNVAVTPDTHVQGHLGATYAETTSSSSAGASSSASVPAQVIAPQLLAGAGGGSGSATAPVLLRNTR